MGAPEEQNEGSSHRKFGGGSEAINNRKRKRGARPNLFSSRMGIKGLQGGRVGGPLTWWRIRGFSATPGVEVPEMELLNPSR